MRASRLWVAVGLSALSLGAAGCAGGGGNNGQICTSGEELIVSPPSATADHGSMPPGNQQQFTALVYPTASPAGCPVPEVVLKAMPIWTSSDTQNIQISSAHDATNGTAVCVGATNGAATLTATFISAQPTLTATATLTCK